GCALSEIRRGDRTPATISKSSRCTMSASAMVRTGEPFARCRRQSAWANTVACRAASVMTSSASATQTLSLDEGRVDEIAHGANQQLVVRQRRDYGAVACLPYGNAAGNQPRSGDQKSRAGHLGQSAVAQAAKPVAQRNQCDRSRMVSFAFPLDDCCLALGRRELEIKGHESLPGAGLQVFQHALVAGIVRHDQLKPGCRFDRFACLV